MLNGTHGGVRGLRGAIPVTRPDLDLNEGRIRDRDTALQLQSKDGNRSFSKP